ncbi:MAG TPA: translation elongation factor 4 [Elusimicrobiales bacterium]|nr:translation elongation factor 4 [Elusimicrobiales bacterium]
MPAATGHDVAHAHLAKTLGLAVIPVINKVDLSQSDADSSEEQIWEVLKNPVAAERVSAKTGLGLGPLLERIVRDIPPPAGGTEKPLSALIFDSYYDTFRGVVLYIRVFDGEIRPGMQIKLFASGLASKVEEVGCMTPELKKLNSLKAGEVGYLIAGIKDIHSVKMGDTVMNVEQPLAHPLPGYKDAKPVVFASIFPVNPADYNALRTAIEKLNLSDSSFHYQTETSKALGFGFRLGFMGLLHMEIVKERLEREFDLNLIVTSPNVVYNVKASKSVHHAGGYEGYKLQDNPANFPHYGDIEDIQEPYVHVTIVTPVSFMDGVMVLLKEKRGNYIRLEHMGNQRVIIEYEVPLAEIVLDFYDKLKSVSKGYASFDYEMVGYRSSDVVVMEILLHASPVDALSVVIHKEKAQMQGRLLCEKLKELIPRQYFEIAVQARVNGKIIARETIPAIRKDVLAKCYGGDITRKRKLLEKQKEGRRKLKNVGNVDVPQEAFIAILKIQQ